MKPARTSLLRIDAAAMADGAGFFAAPASVLVEVGEREDGSFRGWHTRTLAVGRTAEVLRHEANRAAGLGVISRPESVLIPGLVNAHTHLDLTHLGPCPYDPEEGFVAWVGRVRTGRRTDEAGIAESVRRGIELSLAAGVVAVGDIAGAPRARPDLTPWRTLRASGMRGVSFLEFFSIGRDRELTLGSLEAAVAEAGGEAGAGAALGIQPHAPNTVALSSYRRAIALAAANPAAPLPLCTHLAETPEEREFIATGTGPQRELLEGFGLWTGDILGEIGKGRTPVEHLAGVLAEARFLAAHINDADDRAIETLARTGTRVAYCPHASAYFAAERRFGPHRYRDMLAAGVCVALGTDSIVNLPAGSDRPGHGLSILGEMRLLFRRDRTPAETLLRMGTLDGAAALGLPAEAFGFGEGHPIAGAVAVGIGEGVGPEPSSAGGVLKRMLGTETPPPELLFADTHSGFTRTSAGTTDPKAYHPPSP